VSIHEIIFFGKLVMKLAMNWADAGVIGGEPKYVVVGLNIHLESANYSWTETFAMDYWN
jgi:hypothetical protein